MKTLRGVASGAGRAPLATAWFVLLAATPGCGGRSSACDALQTGCNSPPPLPTGSAARVVPSALTPAAPVPARPPVSSRGYVPIPTPATPPLPGPQLPAPPSIPAPPLDQGAEAVEAAARAAGCIPAADSEATDLEGPPYCYSADSHYFDTSIECTETWCGRTQRPISSCTPVAMSFAGGHHYRFSGDGYDADFFFTPIGSITDPTPLKENFGWVQLTLRLGDTLDTAQSVSAAVYLHSEQAFAAGLDVVDGTIIGPLIIDPSAEGVQGPLYQPSCTSVTDELGRVVPGDCACRFVGAKLVVPLYVPLGPLFGDEPAEPPALPDAVDAGALP